MLINVTAKQRKLKIKKREQNKKNFPIHTIENVEN